MAKKRTTKALPKKRPKKKATTKKKPTKKKKATTKKKPTTKKKLTIRSRKINPSDYLTVSENTRRNKFIEIGQRVYKGELRWMYYSIDGNTGYHYYKKLKKNG